MRVNIVWITLSLLVLSSKRTDAQMRIPQIFRDFVNDMGRVATRIGTGMMRTMNFGGRDILPFNNQQNRPSRPNRLNRPVPQSLEQQPQENTAPERHSNDANARVRPFPREGNRLRLRHRTRSHTFGNVIDNAVDNLMGMLPSRRHRGPVRKGRSVNAQVSLSNSSQSEEVTAVNLPFSPFLNNENITTIPNSAFLTMSEHRRRQGVFSNNPQIDKRNDVVELPTFYINYQLPQPPFPTATLVPQVMQTVKSAAETNGNNGLYPSLVLRPLPSHIMVNNKNNNNAISNLNQKNPMINLQLSNENLQMPNTVKSNSQMSNGNSLKFSAPSFRPSGIPTCGFKCLWSDLMMLLEYYSLSEGGGQIPDSIKTKASAMNPIQHNQNMQTQQRHQLQQILFSPQNRIIHPNPHQMQIAEFKVANNDFYNNRLVNYRKPSSIYRS